LLKISSNAMTTKTKTKSVIFFAFVLGSLLSFDNYFASFIAVTGITMLGVWHDEIFKDSK